MNLKPLGAALVILTLFAAGYAAFAGKMAKPSELSLVIETSAGKRHPFTIEIAESPAELMRGLMKRKEMPASHGMLFKMPSVHAASFWMKDTLIPLDIIFIRADGRIANIGHGVPLSLTPIPSTGPVSGVLEINGGMAARLGIAAGDRVVHPFFVP